METIDKNYLQLQSYFFFRKKRNFSHLIFEIRANNSSVQFSNYLDTIGKFFSFSVTNVVIFPFLQLTFFVSHQNCFD